MKRILIGVIIVSLLHSNVSSQQKARIQSDVYVDTMGVLRWKETNEEVTLFGVNYTVPFAYAYRAHKRLGLSLEEAIELDVAQMVRLGFDAFRVHVWDREITDSLGNLLNNEHLRLFDYLLWRLAEYNIKCILTPIAWWGNGWPEPDRVTPGFSQNFRRIELITDQRARSAERRYLAQFINHYNPYRKLRYKDDAVIIALEIINEPTHPEDPNQVLDYINEMVAAIREAGFRKPIFYNASQNWSEEQARAVLQANVDGITFQWYPTDLVHRSTLSGNFLLNVDHYVVPFDTLQGYTKKAKIVYEFDAADVAGSYMYPAMARSFREAGMQFAAMFSYDPTQIAWSNTEYPTHYLNLLYTPSKALSLMIAGKVFHRLPRFASYGNYPRNTNFENFRVDYEHDLSEMNNETEFIYTNSTPTIPKNLTSLCFIAGCGNSPVVQYDGTGSYFLEKCENGIWYLEVYPDVLWLNDPFGYTSLSREVARLFWNKRNIVVRLPDLGDRYSFYRIKKVGEKVFENVGFSTVIEPGKYFVCAENIDPNTVKKYMPKKNLFLDGIYIPKESLPNIYVVNMSDPYTVEGNIQSVRFRIAGIANHSRVSLYLRRMGWRNFSKYPLHHSGGFEFRLMETPWFFKEGVLEYCLVIEDGINKWTFPGAQRSTPDEWDFMPTPLWTIQVLRNNTPFVLFHPERDRERLVVPHFTDSRKYSVLYRNGTTSDRTSLVVTVQSTHTQSTPFGFQLGISDIFRGVLKQVASYHSLEMKARTDNDSTEVTVALLLSNGHAYGVHVPLKKVWQKIDLPLPSFKKCSVLLLPNSYPTFLPYVWNPPTDENDRIDLSLLDHIQIIINERNHGSDLPQQCSIEVESIILKP